VAVLTIAALAVTGTAATGLAQESDWREVENPYQEDIEYTMGASVDPRVLVDGVRWRSFTIEAPDEDPFAEGATVEVELRVEVENRRSSGARILVILLLENADGEPLGRIEARQFKVAPGRLKGRSDSVQLSRRVIDSTRRVYLFFEVME